jgi:hypothetical protein
MQLDDWVLCRIYKKTTPQLAYMSPPHEEASPSMDGGGLDHGLQPDDSVSADDIVAATSSYASRLPRPASISDYLVDYSAVSELFETLAPETTTTTQPGTDAATRFYFGTSDPAASASSVAQQQSPLKRRSMEEDYSNSGMNMLHASSTSKRVMSDHHHASSMAANNAFSVFEPAGQTTLQDRI